MLPATLYQLFGIACFLGWLAGNLCNLRRRRLPAAAGRRLIWLYLICPPGLLVLLRALAPEGLIAESPLAPIFAVCVYGVFYALPVTLGRSR